MKKLLILVPMIVLGLAGCGPTPTPSQPMVVVPIVLSQGAVLVLDGTATAPISVPGGVSATIRIDQSTVVSELVTVDGCLTIEGTDPAKTVTFAGGLTGSGTLVASGAPSLLLPAGTYAPTLASTANASLALACTSSSGRVAFMHALTQQTFHGSLDVRGGMLILPGAQSIGGALTVEPYARLHLDTGSTAPAAGTPLFTAACGIKVSAGRALTDSVSVAQGTVRLSANGTQIAAASLAPTVNTVATAKPTAKVDHVDYKSVDLDANLQNWVKIEDIRRSKTNDGYARVQVLIKNLTGSTIETQYRFDWQNSNGVVVQDVDHDAWEELALVPGDNGTYTSIAPKKDCKDFRLRMRYVRPE